MKKLSNNDLLKQLNDLNDLMEQQKEQSQNLRQIVNNMDEKSQYMGIELEELFDAVHKMRWDLNYMFNELQEARLQISQQPENQPKIEALKEKLVDKVDNIQYKILTVLAKLEEIERHLLETAAQAINAFKNKSVAAMSGILQKGISAVKPMLYECRENLINEVKSCEKVVNQIDSIGDELKKARNNVSNAGRLMAGKDTKEISDEKTGVALTRLINAPIKNVVENFKECIAFIEDIIGKLEQLSEKLNAVGKSKRSSVKEKLANNKAYIELSNNSSPKEVKEKAQPEVVL